MHQHIAILLIFAAFRGIAAAQYAADAFPLRAIIPRVTCLSDPKQSYALYLPSTFSVTRKWPTIYVFDPFAHGHAAVEVVRAAAENLGYIVVASNNSKNGSGGWFAGSRSGGLARHPPAIAN